MIAFFGLDILLNQQTGGFLASFEPSLLLMDFWRNARRRFFHLLEGMVEGISQEMVQRLCAWGDVALADLEAHPEETGVDRHPVMLPRHISMPRQSLPLQISGGHTLWVVLGKDITQQNYLAGRGFFDSGCRAAELLMGILESCQDCSSPAEQMAIREL